jgi:hypothetical protein
MTGPKKRGKKSEVSLVVRDKFRPKSEAEARTLNKRRIFISRHPATLATEDKETKNLFLDQRSPRKGEAKKRRVLISRGDSSSLKLRRTGAATGKETKSPCLLPRRHARHGKRRNKGPLSWGKRVRPPRNNEAKRRRVLVSCSPDVSRQRRSGKQRSEGPTVHGSCSARGYAGQVPQITPMQTKRNFYWGKAKKRRTGYPQILLRTRLRRTSLRRCRRSKEFSTANPASHKASQDKSTRIPTRRDANQRVGEEGRK